MDDSINSEPAASALIDQLKAINNALVNLHPEDLPAALLEMSEEEKQWLLDYYKSHECYLHCDIIYKMKDAHNNESVHDA